MNQPVANQFYPIANATSPSTVFIEHFEADRDPNGNDINYQIQQRWWNKFLRNEWVLIGFTSAGGVVQAIWEPVSSAVTTEALQGNSGGPVGPDINNIIHTIGASPITVVGNPGTNTLTWQSDGTVATSYVENSGTAIPAGGILNVLGISGITTTGSGNTIDIAPGGSIATTYVANTGSATPSGNVLNILGTGTISTTGAGSTITISETPVTMPAFFAFVSASVPNVTGDSTLYTVLFDTIQNQQGGSNYNPATGTFTAPSTGWYIFNYAVRTSSIGSNTQAGGFINLKTTTQTIDQFDTNVFVTQTPIGAGIVMNGTAFVKMNATDTAVVQFNVEGGAKDVGITFNPAGTDTYFSGARLL